MVTAAQPDTMYLSYALKECSALEGSDAQADRRPEPFATRGPSRPRCSEVTSVTIVGFVIIEFVDDDNGYIAWLADHPDGYVLNCKRPHDRRT